MKHEHKEKTSKEKKRTVRFVTSQKITVQLQTIDLQNLTTNIKLSNQAAYSMFLVMHAKFSVRHYTTYKHVYIHVLFLLVCVFLFANKKKKLCRNLS